MGRFKERVRWHATNRHEHLLQATASAAATLPPAAQRTIADRARRLRLTLRVRMVAFAVLYAGLIASASAIVLATLPGGDELGTAVRWLASIAGGLSSAVGIFILLLARHAGQLEAEIHATWFTALATR